MLVARLAGLKGLVREEKVDSTISGEDFLPHLGSLFVRHCTVPDPHEFLAVMDSLDGVCVQIVVEDVYSSHVLGAFVVEGVGHAVAVPQRLDDELAGVGLRRCIQDSVQNHRHERRNHCLWANLVLVYQTNDFFGCEVVVVLADPRRV